MELIPRSKFNQIHDQQIVSEQIQMRRELQRDMVGLLYPSILESEIYDLQKIGLGITPEHKEG